MGGPVLIDTNVFIDLFKGRLPEPAEDELTNTLNSEVYYLSVINKIELLGFATDDLLQMQYMSEIVENSIVLPIEEQVVEQVIQLRRSRKIKLPDAIIVATALVHKLTVISRNTKDFAKVKGLQHVDPYKL